MNKLLSFIKKYELLSVALLCGALVVLCCAYHGVKALIPKPVPLDQWSEKQIAAEAENCPLAFESDLFLVAVSQALNCSPEDLTEERLSEVESLRITGLSKLKNINDIRYFPNLKQLVIRNCSVQDVTALSGLTKLENLDLSENRISDIDCLSLLSSLLTLDVSDNRVASISAVEELENLVEADFADNHIRQIADISQMKSLTKLSVADNQISDLSFAKTGGLISLNISYCNIENLDELAQCETLEELYIYGYDQMDLSPLHALPNFCSLFLSQWFDRSQLDFMADSFKTADKYTKVYLVARNRGLELARSKSA